MSAWSAANLESVLGKCGVDALARSDAYLPAESSLRFLARLSNELDQGSVVVAIGSGHIVGASGMVALMRDAGNDVTRIPLPGEAE